MYRFGIRDAGTRERLPISEVFHKLLRLCDANAETDPDQTFENARNLKSAPKICRYDLLLGQRDRYVKNV